MLARMDAVPSHQLQVLMQNLLNQQEQHTLLAILQDYSSARDVYSLVDSLKSLLDTPAKCQLLTLLRRFIMKRDGSAFDELLPGYHSGSLPRGKSSRAAPAFTTRHPSPSPRSSRSASGTRPLDLPPWEPPGRGRTRQVMIDLSGQQSHPHHGLGFSIRGGAEHGIGIYVSYVDVNSIAETEGLVPGDQLLGVNGISFRQIAHTEAAKIIKASLLLDMEVRNVGRVPGSFETHQTYSWVDAGGRSVSPPPEVDRVGRYDPAGSRKSGLMLLKDSDERKVYVHVDGIKPLGLMIRGGSEFGLGIYITGVDPHSVAEFAGIKGGDQLLDVNGHSFLDITHNEAVATLKASKHMMLTIKDVGKLPYARSTYDHTQWLPQGRNPTSNAPSQAERLSATSQQEKSESMFLRGAGSQLMHSSFSSQQAHRGLLEEHTRQLLSAQEHATLTYYLQQYEQQSITVSSLALALTELLNTPAKLGLKAELRGLISAPDLADFDRQLSSPPQDMLVVSRPGEDAGLDLAGTQVSPNRCMSCNAPAILDDIERDSICGHHNNTSAQTHIRTQHEWDLLESFKREDAGTNQNYPNHQTETDLYEVIYPRGSRSDDQRFPSSSNARFSSVNGTDLFLHDAAGESKQGEDRTGSQSAQGHQQRPAQGMPGLPAGTVELVTLYKTQPSLGLAIEGGANTKQPLPRIISIQPGGSAHDSGGLKVGHLVLEVNGKSLRGLEHQQCARLIAEAFKNKKAGHLELLVLDPEADNVRF